MAICALALIQCVLRFAFPAYISQAGFPVTDKVVTPEVQAMILAAFVLIGIAGIFTTYGLLIGARFGYVGTIALSVATIAFDVWAIEEVQATALMGMVLPAIFIIYLIANRADFPKGVRVFERVGGVRN